MAEDLFKKTILKWGRESQIDMTIEECAELILALHKLTKRKYHPALVAGRIANVCEELADVQIMINKMKALFGHEDVDAMYNIKMERLQNLLNENSSET